MKINLFCSIAFAAIAMTLSSCSKEEPVTPEVVHVELEHLPAKVDYYVGEEFDVSGLALKVTYSDKLSKVVSVEKEQVTGFNSTVPNAALALQVKESGFVVTFSIKILANNAPAILIKTQPSKTIYTLGESLSLEGMVLAVTYQDGTTKEIHSVSPDWIKGFDSSKPSLKQSLQIDIDGIVAAFDITVLPIQIVNNELVSSGASDVKVLSIPEGVTTIKEDAFFNNSTIEEVIFPASLKSIGEYAFTNCVNLKKVDLSKTSITVLPVAVFDRAGLVTLLLPSTLKRIEGDALTGTTMLKELTLPEGVEWIGTTAFTGSGLETITLPNTVRYIERAFYNCPHLKTIRTAGSKVTTGLEESTIASECFNHSPNIEVLEIPESITQIGVSALGACKIKTLVLPASVKILDHHAFGNTPSLEVITLKSATMVEASYKSIPDEIKTIKVPSLLVNQYKGNENWRMFADKIVAL